MKEGSNEGFELRLTPIIHTNKFKFKTQLKQNFKYSMQIIKYQLFNEIFTTIQLTYPECSQNRQICA